MIKLKILLIFTLLALTIIAENSTEAKPKSDIVSHKVGSTIKVKSENGKAFTLIEIEQLKSKYFFIHIKMDWDSKNIPVKIYIFKKGEKQAIKVCSQHQIDSCYLSREDLTTNMSIVILTNSKELYYGYTLQTYWSNIQHLEVNSSSKFFFGDNDHTQFYHLELNSTDFHELKIVLKPQTYRSPFDKVKIYGSFGSNSVPDPQKYDFSSIHLWEEAEGIFLYGHQIKDKNINLFIVSEIETVYILSCEIINSTHRDIQVGETVHQYLQPKQDFLYHAKFGEKLIFDEYLFTFSGFNGQLSLKFFQDKDKKQPFEVQPFQYLNDAQYVFKKANLEKFLKNGLYIYTATADKKAVFTINFKGRNSTSAIQLKQSIYEFIQISHDKAEQLAYFQVLQWSNANREEDIKYSVSLTNVYGRHTLEFRICDEPFEDCINNQTYKSSTVLLEARVTTIGIKYSYLLSLKKQFFKQLNFAESEATVIIVMRRTNGEKSQIDSFVALEYRSQNKVQFLRQNKPLQSRIAQGQYKMFKFQNQDQNMKQVRIYTNQISGKISIFSMRQQPHEDQKFGKQQTNSIISFTEDLSTKPIYLIVRGNQQAIFSIQAVPFHISDKTLSAFTLSEDLSFSVKVKPQGFEVVQVTPIYGGIYLEYEASGSFMICPIDKNTNDCEQTFQPQITIKGQIKINPFSQASKMFKILNLFQTEVLKVTLIYHSKDYAHCEHKQFDTLYYDVIHRKQIVENGKENNCYHFPVLQNKNITVSLSRADLGQLHYGISVCDQMYASNQEISSQTFDITAQEVKQLCVEQKQKYITLIVNPVKTQEQVNKIIVPYKIKYLFEYADQNAITIPDGVSYEFQAQTTQAPVKTFYYDMINKKNTTIKLVEQSGFGTIAVKIVQTATKGLFIDDTDYDFVFQKIDGHFLNPTLTITKEDLQKNECKECSLIIKVFSNEQIGKTVRFGIEVSQNHIHLQDNKPREGFLSKGSFDFYTYTALSKKNQGSLIIQINDNNRHCVSIFLSDFDYADDKNHLETESGNRLVYKDVQPAKAYYISIQAKEECPYSIIVTSAHVPISKLKRGVNVGISLKAGETKFFMFEHLQKKEFKILSILKHGETRFFMKKSSLTDLEQFMDDKHSKFIDEDFEIQSEFSNRIVLHANNKYLTPNSYYLIAVQGISDTEGYIFYGDSLTSISIIEEATINDQLTILKETFRGKYYGIGQITLEVNVLSGELGVKMKSFDKEQIINKKFMVRKQSYIEKFNVESDGKSIFLKEPNLIQFKALKENTVYSFKFKKNLSQKQIKSKSHFELKPGQPNFLSIQKEIGNYTLTGIFTHQEQIFISVAVKSKTELGLLSINGFLNDKQAQIQKQVSRNIMKIKFKNIEKGAQKFKLQVKSTVDISTTIYQNYGLNLLAEDTEVLIEGVSNYVLHPEGSLILDVFECVGNANIEFYQSTFQGSSRDGKEIEMDQLASQPHAMKIINPGTTLLRIQTAKAFARWLPMNSQTEQGMGYLNYDIGTLQYEGSLFKLSIEWVPVHSKRQTKTKISKSGYVIIIAEKIQSIKAAIHCENYNDTGLLYYRYENQIQNKQYKLSFDLDKFQIVKKYSQNKNLFIGMVAEVQIQIPEQNIEHYRFIYPTQQIPLQVFKDYEVAKKDYWLVALVSSGALFFIIATIYICCKKIIPLISRLSKGNQLVEETKQQKQFESLPPSSDRNQREVETEYQMKN